MNHLKASFFLRKSGSGEKTVHHLYCRLIYGDQRVEISMGHKIDPSEWDPSLQRPSSTSMEAMNALADIQSIVFKVGQYGRMVMEHGEYVYLAELKERIAPKTVECNGILNLYTKHNKRLEELIDIEFAKATRERQHAVTNT